MNRFIKPKILSPFYNYNKIPRKLKKQVKKTLGIHYFTLTCNQRLWHYLEYYNKDYKIFLINKICQK